MTLEFLCFPQILQNVFHTAACYLCIDSGEVSQGGLKINRGPIPSPLSSRAISGEWVQGSKRIRKKKHLFLCVHRKQKSGCLQRGYAHHFPSLGNAADAAAAPGV